MAFTVLGWIFPLPTIWVMSKAQVATTMDVSRQESVLLHVRRWLGVLVKKDGI